MIFSDVFYSLGEKLIYFWVKSKILAPKDKPSWPSPLVYVLRRRSKLDLMVLDVHCRILNLPSPRHSHVYLEDMGVLRKKRSKELPGDFQEFLKNLTKDVFLAPALVFWGRYPDKSERSLSKLLFLDDEHGGWWHQFFGFWFHGKNVFCHIEEPFSLQNILKSSSQDEGKKKLRRLLRVHFYQQRMAIMGPPLYDRSRLLSSLISGPKVQNAMGKSVQENGTSWKQEEEKAKNYAQEIAAAMSPGGIRFLDVFLGWLWKKVYEGILVHNGQRCLENRVSVYLPIHRSHMDYLLLGYSIYHLGLMPPHTAAGVNLNFWPVGWLLRKGGAFFLRRTFKNNPLYSTIFGEYVHELLQASYPLNFYIEGGRSRTGRVLEPRMGLLSIVLKSALRHKNSDVCLLPVYIAYDKILDLKSYAKELKGFQKKDESFLELLKSYKILFSHLGRAYLNFSKPIFLKEFLHKNLPEWQTISMEDFEKSGAFFTLVENLAKEVMFQVQKHAVLTDAALVALVLRPLGGEALDEDLSPLGEECLVWIKSLWPEIVIEPSSFQKALERSFALGLVDFDKTKKIWMIPKEMEAQMSYAYEGVFHLILPLALQTQACSENSTVLELWIKILKTLFQGDWYLRLEKSQVIISSLSPMGQRVLNLAFLSRVEPIALGLIFWSRTPTQTWTLEEAKNAYEKALYKWKIVNGGKTYYDKNFFFVWETLKKAGCWESQGIHWILSPWALKLAKEIRGVWTGNAMELWENY